jgi:hypothetical protein
MFNPQKKVPISFRLSSATIQRLRADAKDWHRTLTMQLEVILEQHFARNGKAKP